MLSLCALRIMCQFQRLQPLNRLTTKGLRFSKPATYAKLCNVKSNHMGTRNRNTNSTPTKRGVTGKDNTSSLRTYGTAQAEHSCWNCNQPLGKSPAFFCNYCNVVQAPDGVSSYFQIMECNHSFTLDTHKLQKRYLKLQRSLHPDNFIQKTEKEQEYSERQSALVNEAYRTLLKPLSRGLYMLELKGMHLEEGTDSLADPLLLLDLMEINEALQEAKTPEEANRIGRNTGVKLADLTRQIDEALHRGDLEAAKALLTHMKYFTNIEEKVKEKLSRFM